MVQSLLFGKLRFSDNRHRNATVSTLYNKYLYTRILYIYIYLYIYIHIPYVYIIMIELNCPIARSLNAICTAGLARY